MHINLHRDQGKTFPKIENIADVTSAYIWYCKYRTLALLAQFVNLEELVIAGFPDETLDALSGLSKLRYLRILHMPKVSSLMPLGRLRSLETLALETSPSWDSSNRWLIVDSLAPLAGLPSLRHLELLGVKTANGSLAELRLCPSLETAVISKLPNEEDEKFMRETGIREERNPEPTFASEA